MRLFHYISLIIIFLTLGVVLISTPNRPTKIKIAKPKEQPVMVLIDSCTTATIYHAIPKECDGDCSHPANPRFTIDLSNPQEHHIIAIERTMRKKYNLKWGDIVYIEGTDYDGYWQVQDVMNKKYKGQSRIDLLVDNDIHYGKWKNVKVYKVQGSDNLLDNIRSEHMLESL